MNLPTLSLSKITGRLEVSRAASLVSPIAAIIASALIIVLVVWPKFSEVLRLRTANEQLASRARTLEEKVTKLQNLDRSLLEEQLSAAEQLLPSDKAVFSLVGQVERAVGTSGVLLNGIEVAPGVLDPSEQTEDKSKPASGAPATAKEGEAEIAPKIQVKVSVGSDYKSFIQFLTNIVSMSRVVSIKDLSLSSSGESNQVKAALTIDAYWQVLPKELPSIEAPFEEITDSESARLEQVRTTGLVSPPVAVPVVPLGRSDLFAPF